MYYVNIQESLHDWEKLNLVTIEKKNKIYDELECKKCGIKGKRISFSDIEVSSKYNEDKVNYCVDYKLTAKKIKITKCFAAGKVFSNLTPDSIHEVIKAPAPNIADNKGVWVQGVGEPVKILRNEFIILE